MRDHLRFDDRVALITGAGNGLGKAHALLFAARGAKVVVNDLGGSHTGSGASSAAADLVVAEIKEAGGEAVANYDSVEDGDKLVQTAMDNYGRIDIVVNNAGILRDTSFAKLTEEDWDLIYRVHVLGSFRVTHAAWPHMRQARYGRVVFTASAAGIYGNFGQANYAMAKLGVVGLCNTLALEGGGRNILVNTIAPLAGSRMTETILPPAMVEALAPEYVSPLVAWLSHEDCQANGGLYEVGGGFFGKLRWQRAAGRMYRVGRPISIEDVQRSWPEITDFEHPTHPTDVNASLQPILGNVQEGPSLGGNEFIDLDLAVGYEYPPTETSYDERDLALYALGVGAADDAADGPELQTAYELHGDGFRSLPTYGVVPAINAMLSRAKDGLETPGLNFGFDRLLHGEQLTEITRPLPASATLTHHTRITDIYDKGKHAVVVYDTRSLDEDGDELIRNRFSAVIRGAGGWGGKRGDPLADGTPPEREPDAIVEQKIGANQALLYRLSGDWNPMHADPDMAVAFGFERPILHGLCTFGYAARHVIGAFCDGDPRFFKNICVRFADSVFPGETLVTEMWQESDLRIVFRTTVKERDAEVLSRASIELYAEIPKKAPKAAPAAEEAAAPVSAEPVSADVFNAISAWLADDPALAAKVKTDYVFELKDPDSAWTLDMRAAPGSVTAGGGKAACVLEMSDSDFMDMCTGKADPQQLYFGGKMKISGNVMASQKLEFLQKLDPERVHTAAQARAGSGGAAPAPAAPTGPTSAGVFGAIAGYVAGHPELVAKVGCVYQFHLRDPESIWTLDLKNGAGACVPGSEPKAECTLDLSDADFMDMTGGKADPQQLYFGGKLKITGNVMASQKLEFLSQLDPSEFESAAARAPAPVAAAPTEESEPQSPALFAALADRLAADAGIAAEVAALIQFKIAEPDGAWVVDLRPHEGSVTEGEAADVDAVLSLAEEDLVALAKEEATARDLFQRGKLAVDGDVAVARKLGFLNGLV